MSFSEDSEQGSFLELAQGYYEEIWQSLTVHEQLAPSHLSRNYGIHETQPSLFKTTQATA